jgi:pyruvate formate-lyase activating enzyme-like uncharacterized protein
MLFRYGGRDFSIVAGSVMVLARAFMTPEQAFELQIERYREMTCGERIEIALRLHELASEVARAGIRAQHPDADAAEVERQLLERRRLAYQL